MSKKAQAATNETTSTEPVVELSRITEFQAQVPAIKELHKTWNGVFRYLKAQNFTTGEIAKITGKRYQHVRNGLSVPIASVQVDKPEVK